MYTSGCIITNTVLVGVKVEEAVEVLVQTQEITPLVALTVLIQELKFK